MCLDQFLLTSIPTPEPLFFPFSALVQKLSIFSLWLVIYWPSFSEIFISTIPTRSYFSSSSLSTNISNLCLFPFNLLILCTAILILFLISAILMLPSVAFKVSSLWFLFCNPIFCCTSFPSCTRWVSFNSTGAKVKSSLESLVLAH